jgi:hypothetical protein
MVKAFFLITFLVFLCHPGSAQTVEPALPGGVEDVYLAKDDGSGKAGEQVTEFDTTDVPIYCVVLLESNAKTVVKMIFVAVNVAGVKPETNVVSTSYTTTDGQNRVNFAGRPEGKWTPGKYRVDLFLDGRKVKDVRFDIKNVSGKPGAVEPFRPVARPKPKPMKRIEKNQP